MLQPALFNVNYFIKKTFGMKTKHTAKAFFFIFFVKTSGRQIFFCTKRVLQLIPVKFFFFTTQYLLHFGQFYFSYSLQVIVHLLLLVLQLFCIRQHLPLTSAT